MGKKKRRKVTKPKSPVLYPLEICYTIKRIIEMYRAIVRYKTPKWVCLCDPVSWWYDLLEKKSEWKRGDRPFRNCELCPAYHYGDENDCNGPGGEYEPIKCLLDGDSLEDIHWCSNRTWNNKKEVREHARVKANAWAEWLKEQKRLWALQGVKL